MIALYTVISGACCLAAGFLIGFFVKRPAKSQDGPSLQKEIEELKNDLEKKDDALSSLKGEKEQADCENAALNERCRGYEERIKESDSRFEKEQNERRERDRDRDLRQSKIFDILSPMKDRIADLQKKLSSIEENRSEEVGELKGSIEGLKSVERDIQEENRNLSGLLNNNQLRGRWGEIQLQNLVEKCGMNEHVDFNIQLSLKAKGGDEGGRPDLVIHFPGNGAMPVDSKAPIEKFKEQEAEGKTDPGKDYAKVVKGHVDTLSKRNYPKLLLENGYEPLNFTVAYIPVASWFQEAIAADPDLLDYAFSKNVVLCSSVSFWALLQTVRVSWKNFQLQEEVQNIRKEGEDIYDSLVTFFKHLDKLGSGLKNALDGYNTLIGNVESRLVPRARKLRDTVGQKEFQEPSEIETYVKVPKPMKREGEEK